MYITQTVYLYQIRQNPSLNYLWNRVDRLSVLRLPEFGPINTHFFEGLKIKRCWDTVPCHPWRSKVCKKSIFLYGKFSFTILTITIAYLSCAKKQRKHHCRTCDFQSHSWGQNFGQLLASTLPQWVGQKKFSPKVHAVDFFSSILGHIRVVTRPRTCCLQFLLRWPYSCPD